MLLLTAKHYSPSLLHTATEMKVISWPPHNRGYIGVDPDRFTRTTNETTIGGMIGKK